MKGRRRRPALGALVLLLLAVVGLIAWAGTTSTPSPFVAVRAYIAALDSRNCAAQRADLHFPGPGGMYVSCAQLDAQPRLGCRLRLGRVYYEPGSVTRLGDDSFEMTPDLGHVATVVARCSLLGRRLEHHAHETWYFQVAVNGHDAIVGTQRPPPLRGRRPPTASLEALLGGSGSPGT